MAKKSIKIKKSNPNVYRLSHSDIVFDCHYPDENSENAIDDITKGLNHIGVFEGINIADY